MRTPITHDLQRVHGHRHPPLGDGGKSNRGGNGGTWTVDTGLVGIFLCQQWLRRLNPCIEDT